MEGYTPQKNNESVLNSILENPKVKSVVELRFFRHSIKESDKTKSDNDIELTQEGREKSVSEAEDTTNLNQSVAFGSPRKRTQETAMFVMSGQEDDITGNETFKELKEKLEKDIQVGSKIGVEKKLNFYEVKDTPLNNELLEAFGKKEYFKFLVEKSDERAKELNDKGNPTYTRHAQQIARIIDKYVHVSSRWSELVSKNPDKYMKTLERFMGTHQGVGECFLAKVIELTEGKEKRDQLVSVLGNQGFDFVGGFKTYVVDKGNENPEIVIEYKHIDPKDPTKNFEFKKEITPELIQQILKEEA